ncbi:MAG: hypothetical protein ACFFKA_08950 [Candidatus Thorarchaeota archaeon]
MRKLNLILFSLLISGCTLVPIIGVHERVWCERDYKTGMIKCPDEKAQYEVDCELEPLDYACEEI